MKENLPREEIAKIDRADMLGRVLSMPQHFLEALQRVQSVRLELNTSRIQNIVVAGMGGSAISGELTRSLTSNQLPAPLSVCRSYHLPNFVNHHSLVIVSSYSGNTEE
ncbi:MAG: bifunctional phosphoglucose/phosphomannose isomerase, partial [bacterium]